MIAERREAYIIKIGKVILQITYKLLFIIEIEYNKLGYFIFYIIFYILSFA